MYLCLNEVKIQSVQEDLCNPWLELWQIHSILSSFPLKWLKVGDSRDGKEQRNITRLCSVVWWPAVSLCHQTGIGFLHRGGVFPSKACILRIPRGGLKGYLAQTDTEHRGEKTENAVLMKPQFWQAADSWGSWDYAVTACLLLLTCLPGIWRTVGFS